MALETATHINDLVITNPDGLDDLSQGDDHIRKIKDVLKRDIPMTSAASASGLTVLQGTPSEARTALGAAATGSGFRADNNSVNITGIANVTLTRIALSTEKHDTNSEFSSGTFTAKTAGIHRFYFQFGVANPIVGMIIRAFIYVNGVAVARGSTVIQSTSSESVSVYTEVNLAIGNTVDAYVYHSRGTSEDIDGTAIVTYFTGGYLGT